MYAWDNPLRYFDPTGHFTEEEQRQIIGGVAAGTKLLADDHRPAWQRSWWTNFWHEARYEVPEALGALELFRALANQDPVAIAGAVATQVVAEVAGIPIGKALRIGAAWGAGKLAKWTPRASAALNEDIGVLARRGLQKGREFVGEAADALGSFGRSPLNNPERGAVTLGRRLRLDAPEPITLDPVGPITLDPAEPLAFAPESGATRKFGPEHGEISDWGGHLESLGKKKPADMARAHAHHTSMKKGRGRQVPHVDRANAVLEEFDIDWYRGGQNIDWAPNVKGQHSWKIQKKLADELEAVRDAGGTRQDAIEVLERYQAEARGR